MNRIGKLVRSGAHTDYVCQIHGLGEVAVPPSPADYAFGSFVRIPVDAEHTDLVGIIYDTVLLNPEFGNLGPRLSPPSDLAVFSPDYLAEKVTLVGITVVGMLAPDGVPGHGVPPIAAQIDTPVTRMDDGAVRAFHRSPSGGVQVGYVPLLLALGSPLARYLLLRVIGNLEILFHARISALGVLRNELAWQAAIGPLGGGL